MRKLDKIKHIGLPPKIAPHGGMSLQQLAARRGKAREAVDYLKQLTVAWQMEYLRSAALHDEAEARSQSGIAAARERDVLTAKDEGGLTFEAIGKLMGCSRQRAHQLYNRALMRATKEQQNDNQ